MSNKTITIAPNNPVTLALVNPEGVCFDFEVGIGLYETTDGQTFTLPRPAVVILNTLDPDPGEEIVITKHWSGRKGEKAEWTISLSPRSENARAKVEGEALELTEQLQRSIEAVQARKAAAAPPTPKCPACGSDRPDVCQLTGHTYPVTRRPVESRDLITPTPIRSPAKRQNALEAQPRLFDHTQHQPTCNAKLLFDDAACNCGHDGTRYTTANPPRGTGTHGPAPALDTQTMMATVPTVAIGRQPRPGQIPWNIAFREVSAWVAKELSANKLQWSDEAQQAMVCTCLIAEVKAGRIGIWER